MNINNYLNQKNEKVNSLINNVNSDLRVIDSLIKIKKEYNQQGGAAAPTGQQSRPSTPPVVQPTTQPVVQPATQLAAQPAAQQVSGITSITIETVPFNMLKFDQTNPNLLLFDNASLIKLPQGVSFTDADKANFKKYTDPKESINLLVSKDSTNTIRSIEILEPLSVSQINFMPSQLSSDNEIKLNLYKSLIYLDTQNKYVEKFKTLQQRIDTLVTDLSGLRDKLKTKRTNTLLSFTGSYKDQVQKYLNKINETLKTNVSDFNDIVKQIDELDKLKSKITDLAK